MMRPPLLQFPISNLSSLNFILALSHNSVNQFLCPTYFKYMVIYILVTNCLLYYIYLK
jgi:hypothetical protein